MATRKIGGSDYYRKYLKTDHWLKLRAKVLKRDNHTCQSCGSKNKLQIHHKKYRGYYKEKEKDLSIRCEFCHKYYEHSLLGKMLKILYPIVYIILGISVIVIYIPK